MAHFRTKQIDGLTIFYRCAGNSKKPAIVLFHGFPSASHMFRDLIPLLEDEFFVIAPDYPGFGQSSAPNSKAFAYTFEHLTDIIDRFIQSFDLESYFIYVFDYGAPIGFRIAERHPEKILGIVSQNGNVYAEGLGQKWVARQAYWANPTPELREQYKTPFQAETIIGQYTFGTPANSVSPDGYTLDIAYTKDEDYAERQSDLIFDYQTNVAKYPDFQHYLREHQPPLLAVWGKNDPSFIYQGALAFMHDLPNAEIHLLNSGHFALETHAQEIGTLMRLFMRKVLAN